MKRHIAGWVFLVPLVGVNEFIRSFENKPVMCLT